MMQLYGMYGRRIDTRNKDFDRYGRTSRLGTFREAAEFALCGQVISAQLDGGISLLTSLRTRQAPPSNLRSRARTHFDKSRGDRSAPGSEKIPNSSASIGALEQPSLLHLPQVLTGSPKH